MTITYRDELGYVAEEVDSDGINMVDGLAYFNDKQIPITAINSIMEG